MQKSILATSYLVDRSIMEESISLITKPNHGEMACNRAEEFGFLEDLLSEAEEFIRSATKVNGKNCRMPSYEEEEPSLALRKLSNGQYLKVWLDLDAEMASKEKTEASKRAYVEELKKEIEEAKIEQVLVDLNRLNIEAEIGEIEAHRKSEAASYTKSMNETIAKINMLRNELSHTKDIKQKLANTASDLNVLQTEMEFIRAIEKSSRETCKHESQDTKSLLHSTENDVVEANKLLMSLKAESCEVMKEIDVLRRELIQVSAEQDESRKRKKTFHSKLSGLNMKLHMAMTKVESASTSEKRAHSIVSNLYTALEQLDEDSGEAKREVELIAEETKAIREQTRKMNLHTASVQEKFEAALKELKAAKELEASELKNLSLVTEVTMTDRAIVSLFTPTVTISKFEYLYLTGQGKQTQEVADLKVAAARTWLEAFRAEKEVKEREKHMKWAVVPYGKKFPSPKKAKNSLLIKHNSVPKKRKSVQLTDCRNDVENVEFSNIKLAIAMPERSLALNRGIGEAGRSGVRRSSVSGRRRPSFSSQQSPPTTSTASLKAMGNIIKLINNRPYRKLF